MALFGETLTLIVDVVGFTATVALAFFDVFALLVAVTVTFMAEETVGAVNRPLLEIEPADVVQVTPVLVVPWTLAENCRVPAELKVAVLGETVMVMFVVGGATPTTALAFFVESAALVAVTVTFVLLVTLGAVNKPLLETDPALELQVTLVSFEPFTAALNC